MKQGQQRFERYIIQVEALLAQANQTEQPAMFLYQNDARTPFFMLEALSKLYAEMHNKKKFDKIKTWAKELEDGIGAIDFYDHAIKEFKQQQAIPVAAMAYLNEQLVQAISSLDKSLIDKKWIGDNPRITKKIRKKLNEVDWKKEKKECKLAVKQLQSSCEDIVAFLEKRADGFTEMESEVHELRRELRWISIHAKASNGLIQLADTFEDDAHLESFITEATRQSPFNKMPDFGSLKSIILLEENNFYALSTWISKLGDIKDKALSIMLLAEAIEKTEHIHTDKSLLVAVKLLGYEENIMASLLKEASSLSQEMVESDVLTDLIIGSCEVDHSIDEAMED